jgi:RNA polymerase sigma factor (sigma-70 family)
MSVGLTSPILLQIRRMVEDDRTKQRSDQDLLAAFAGRRDEAAFHALVHRHGPMVLDVCRCVLANEADAEDAFQAAFLILARRAGSIRKAGSLGSWLYGVAYRTALHAQRELTRRRKHERHAPPRDATAADDLSWREALRVVHEEVNRLAQRHQAPLVLCYLQGRTQDEAAARLGLAKGTLKMRLEQGRALLRKRLVRRGLGPAALLVASAWPAAAASAGVPASLVSSTVTAAASVAAGAAAAGAVSAKVVTLTEGGLKAMFLSKLKSATVLVLIAGILAGGAGVLTYQALPRAQATPLATGAKDAKKPSADKEQLQGAWSIVSSEKKGVTHTTAETGLREYKLTFKGDKVTTQWVANDERQPQSGGGENNYMIDPAKRPRELTILTELPIQAIYSFEDKDTLKVCFFGRQQGTGRPKEFSTKEGIEGNPIIWTLKREPRPKQAGPEAGDGAAQGGTPPAVTTSRTADTNQGQEAEAAKLGVFVAGVCRKAEDNSPIANAEVQFHVYRRDPSRMERWTGVRTDQNGRFTIKGDLAADRTDDPRRCKICIRSQGRATRIFFWQPDANYDPPVELKLQEPAKLEGRVLDSDGKPVPGAFVHTGTPHINGVNDAVTDKNGHFVIDDLDAVEFNAAVRAPRPDGFQITGRFVHASHPDFLKGRVAYTELPASVEIQLSKKAPDQDVKARDKELGALRGTWSAFSIESVGGNSPETLKTTKIEPKGTTMTVDGEKVMRRRIGADGGQLFLVYRLDRRLNTTPSVTDRGSVA